MASALTSIDPVASAMSKSVEIQARLVVLRVSSVASWQHGSDLLLQLAHFLPLHLLDARHEGLL